MPKKIQQRKVRYMPRKRRKPRAERPKSFASEQAAQKWAEENGVKDYEIKRLRLGLSKKCKIVEK
jgi:hypothetical protein